MAIIRKKKPRRNILLNFATRLENGQPGAQIKECQCFSTLLRREHFEFLLIPPNLFHTYPMKATVKELLLKQNPCPRGTHSSGEVTKSN